MSKDIHQMYVANPITSNLSTDLMHFGQSPYGATNDAAMLWSNFALQFLQPSNNLSDVSSVSTARTNLGLGTIATQNANSVTIGGGSAVFSTLNYGFVYVPVAGDIDLAVTQTNVLFVVGTAGLTISDDLGLASFTNGFQFIIKNTSAGNVQFIPNPPDTIDGASSLTIPAGSSVLIGKLSTEWGVLASYFSSSTPGILGLSEGGTGASLTASAGGVVYSTASAMAFSAVGSSGQLFRSAGTGAPGWTTSTYPATNAANTLLYASSANTMAALATANSGVLVTSSGGVPSISTTLPSGLTIPGYANEPVNTNITSMSGLTGAIQAPTQINDTSGNKLLFFATGGALSVNWVVATNALTGQEPGIQANGSDSTVALSLGSKGGQATIYDTTSTNGGKLSFANAANTFGIILQGPNATSNVTFILPLADGVNGGVLSTNGSGTLSLSRVSFPGGFTFAGTLTGNTAVTFPTSGTLATTASASGTVTSGTINDLAYYAATGTAVSALTTGNNAVLVTSSAGVPSWNTSLGQGLVVASSVLTVGGANNIPFNVGKGLQDSNGNNLLIFNVSPSAVNYFEIENSSTGSGPTFYANGSDTNINCGIASKGTGFVGIYGNSGSIPIAEFNPVASGVNYFSFTSAAAANPANITLAAAGTSSNINLTLGSKGTGNVTIQATTTIAEFLNVASAVNFIAFEPAVTGASPVIVSSGSDTNVGLQISTQGTGGVTIEGTSAASPGNAIAGYVGESISSVIAQASATSLSNNTPKNITSIALTAGDWDVWGNVSIATTGVTTNLIGWISSSTATLPDFSLYASIPGAGAATSGGLSVPSLRFNVGSGGLTVFLSASCSFSTGTATAAGGIYARRRR